LVFSTFKLIKFEGIEEKKKGSEDHGDFKGINTPFQIFSNPLLKNASQQGVG
jgi:hypothetical protein